MADVMHEAEVSEFNKEGDLRFEFSFSPPSLGNTVVAITTNCYGKSMKFALMLERELRQMIPFPHVAVGEADIYVLGGERRKGMLSIELLVNSKWKPEAVRETLLEHGFTEGLERTLN